jgi:DNA-binding response OmpR family regulator
MTELHECPLCGSQRVLRGLRIIDNRVFFHNHDLGFTQWEFDIFHLLFRKQGFPGRHTELHNLKLDSRYPDSDPVNCMKTRISIIRRKLRKVGFPGEIKAYNNVGYILRIPYDRQAPQYTEALHTGPRLHHVRR